MHVHRYCGVYPTAIMRMERTTCTGLAGTQPGGTALNGASVPYSYAIIMSHYTWHGAGRMSPCSSCGLHVYTCRNGRTHCGKGKTKDTGVVNGHEQ